MSGATAIVMAVAAVASVAISAKNGADAKKAQTASQNQAKEAANKAASQADQAAAQADQDMNKANQKQPDTMALLDAAAQAGKSGVSGTMLTGAQGVDPNALALGKTTLLGG